MERQGEEACEECGYQTDLIRAVLDGQALKLCRRCFTASNAVEMREPKKVQLEEYRPSVSKVLEKMTGIKAKPVTRAITSEPTIPEPITPKPPTKETPQPVQSASTQPQSVSTPQQSTSQSTSQPTPQQSTSQPPKEPVNHKIQEGKDFNSENGIDFSSDTVRKMKVKDLVEMIEQQGQEEGKENKSKEDNQ